MKTSLGAALLSSAAVMLFAPTLASGASVVTCDTRVYPGDTPVFVTSARNLTCRAAARQQRRHRWTGANRFTTPGGYRCAPSGRGAIGYQLRCVKGSRAYRIEFED